MRCTARMVLASAAIMSLALASTASAATLYSENFDVDPSANWTVNSGPSDNSANFFFDYSTAGIPSAPNSGGTTRGLKMTANESLATFGGISVSPNGVNLSGDYKLQFDWWANFNGPAPGGGSGSTQLSTFGIGTAGTTPQWPGGSQDSAWFAATGDGGSSVDYRAYSPAAGTGYTSASGVFAAGTGTSSRNGSDPYYVPLTGDAPPAAQALLFPQQTGTPQSGAPAFKWHDVVIEKSGNAITWTVDGLLLVTLDATTFSLGGGNILFGHSDINSTSSSDPNDTALLFTLIDNVRVVPEPASLALFGLAGLGVVAVARRRR